jgi:hypothetical protein
VIFQPSAQPILLPSCGLVEDEPQAPTMSGGLFWCRAQYGLTLSGSSITAIADAFGTGHSVTQATAAQQPTFNPGSATFRGRPTISVDGNDYMASADPWGGGAASQPYTIYYIGTASTVTQGVVTAGLAYPSGGLLYTGPSSYVFYAGTNQIGTENHTGLVRIVCAVFNGASSALYMYSYVTPGLTGNPGAAGFTGLGLFNIPALSLGLTGDVAEIAAYSGAHTVDQRKQWFDFARDAYGASFV